MKKGYWMIFVTVHDADAFKRYVELDTPIIEGFGGKFLARGGQSEAIEGDSLTRQVIVEFPSYEIAKECYHSDAYQECAKIRFEAATSVAVITEGQ